MPGLSDAQNTIQSTFIKLYLKKSSANARDPSWIDMLRGFTGWPHPSAAGHFRSYPFVPFEFLLNSLKMLLVFLPFALSVLITKTLASPLLNSSVNALGEQGVDKKIAGAFGFVGSLFLFALALPTAVLAWLGYCTTAMNDSKELARKEAGVVAAYTSWFLSIVIHAMLFTFIWPAYVGLIGVKILTLVNEYQQEKTANPLAMSSAWETVRSALALSVQDGYSKGTNSFRQVFLVSPEAGAVLTGPCYVLTPTPAHAPYSGQPPSSPPMHHAAPVAFVTVPANPPTTGGPDDSEANAFEDGQNGTPAAGSSFG